MKLAILKWKIHLKRRPGPIQLSLPPVPGKPPVWPPALGVCLFWNTFPFGRFSLKIVSDPPSFCLSLMSLFLLNGIQHNRKPYYFHTCLSSSLGCGLHKANILFCLLSAPNPCNSAWHTVGSQYIFVMWIETVLWGRLLSACLGGTRGFPGWLSGKESTRHVGTKEMRILSSGGEEDALDEEMATTPVLLLRRFHGQRSLVGYSP